MPKKPSTKKATAKRSSSKKTTASKTTGQKRTHKNTVTKKITMKHSANLESEICKKAYDIYQENGYQHGNDQSHWYQAEKAIAKKYNLVNA